MEDYRNGQNTQHVQKHVAKEHNTDHEDVIILHLNMVGKIVQMLSKRTENAKLNHVQVNYIYSYYCTFLYGGS